MTLVCSEWTVTMIKLGKQKITTVARLVVVSLFLCLLFGCSAHHACKNCLTAEPIYNDHLVTLPKQYSPYQERKYDLCLLEKFNKHRKTKIQVIRVGQTWTFVLPSDPLFENDTDDIHRDYQAVLAVVADFMRTYSKITVTVRANLDRPQQKIMTKFGTIEDELTERQAQAVAADLAARKIDARLIIAQGMGSRDPVAWDGTRQGRYLNRRVEITFRYYRDDTAWY